jgi:fatty-acyl-CoA synthase
MKGLMQEQQLNIRMVLERAEQIHGGKTVTTKTSDGVRTATFAEVGQRARRLVTALRDLGVKPGDRVATFAWNSQQHLEAYLAAPAMGAVLHTLNIRLFAEDLGYIVDHAEDHTVIVDRSLWPAWEKVAALVKSPRTVVVVDDTGEGIPDGALDYEELLAGSEPAADLPDVDEGEASAMCYTSGTTGHPKGVVYSHRSSVLHSLMVGLADSMALCEADVVLPVVPMFHANAWGIPYGALMAGADIVFPARFMDPASLTGLLVDRKVSLTAGVPTIWQGMLEPMKQNRAGLKSLSRMVCGGSALPAALQKAYATDLGIPVYHAWGMTETGPLASLSRPMAKHAGLDEESIDRVMSRQGRVVTGVDIRLAGEDGNVVAWDGETSGEIQVRGNWVAAGYYNDDSGREKFTDDGWLRTGDVATIDPDGYIQIVDRTKDLIKSGGEWISSVELEGLIMAHPDVAEAAVVAIPDAKWSERPLACVVPRPEAKDTLTGDAIIEFLRPRVAKWWLPDDVVFIDEVPKTSVGKFDKKVLRERFKAFAPATPAASGS